MDICIFELHKSLCGLVRKSKIKEVTNDINCLNSCGRTNQDVWEVMFLLSRKSTFRQSLRINLGAERRIYGQTEVKSKATEVRSK